MQPKCFIPGIMREMGIRKGEKETGVSSAQLEKFTHLFCPKNMLMHI